MPSTLCSRKGCPGGGRLPYHVNCNKGTTSPEKGMSFPQGKRLCGVVDNTPDLLRDLTSLTNKSHWGGISISNTESDLGLKAAELGGRIEASLA